MGEVCRLISTVISLAEQRGLTWVHFVMFLVASSLNSNLRVYQGSIQVRSSWIGCWWKHGIEAGMNCKLKRTALKRPD
jgi:hypothetical protein